MVSPNHWLQTQVDFVLEEFIEDGHLLQSALLPEIPNMTRWTLGDIVVEVIPPIVDLIVYAGGVRCMVRREGEDVPKDGHEGYDPL